MKNKKNGNPSDIKKISAHRKVSQKWKLPDELGPEWKKWIETRTNIAGNELPISSKKGIILTATYKFTLIAVEKGKLKKVCKEIHQRGFPETRANKMMKRNPFQLCMNYLCSSGVRKVESKQQHKWGRLLHYAYFHKVKPEDLLGFLYQEGSFEVINSRYKKLIAAQA